MHLIDLEAIRKTVAKGLRDYLKIPVIRSNQTGGPPKYPYLSYTITNIMQENKGTWGQYDDDKDRKPYTQYWSITVQSDDAPEAMNLTLMAHEWLDHIGTTYLNDNSVIVQSVGSINNRDNILTIEYEYRNGFDVVLWLLSDVPSINETTGYIEEAIINNVPYSKEYDVDELNILLEQRLEGVT